MHTHLVSGSLIFAKPHPFLSVDRQGLQHVAAQESSGIYALSDAIQKLEPFRWIFTDQSWGVAVKPCFKELRAERDFPLVVLGPVEREALLRLTSVRRVMPLWHS